MAAQTSIVILEHRYERRAIGGYLIHTLARFWHAAGHRVTVHYGPDDPPNGDLLVYNVNLSVVSAEYARLADRYERTINAGVLDIRKSRFSRNLVSQESTWRGPVIVKTDRNYGGLPEWTLSKAAAARGKTVEFTVETTLGTYPIYRDISLVPIAIWHMPGLIVEKFTPERQGSTYFSRIWTFLGHRERSNRFSATDPLVKSVNIIGSEPIEVPDILRRRRKEIGLDFGKIDYVVYQGDIIMLDINKTPSHPRGVDPTRFEDLSQGLSDFIP